MEVKMEYETAKAEGRGGPRWIVRSVLAALFAFCSVLVPFCRSFVGAGGKEIREPRYDSYIVVEGTRFKGGKMAPPSVRAAAGRMQRYGKYKTIHTGP